MTSSVLAIELSLPNTPVSCHICIYLPTAGQENQFISAISSLDFCLEEISCIYKSPYIYIQGDANVNDKNTARVSVLNHLLEKHNLLRVNFQHPTYHHFMGQGQFDSSLDVILHSSEVSEEVKHIVCKLQHPLVQSHHDIVI